MWNIIVNINITTRNTGTYFLLLCKRMGLLFFFFSFQSSWWTAVLIVRASSRSQPRAIEYYEEPRASRRSVSRSRRVSDVRRSDVEVREPRRSSGYVGEREVRREVSRTRY